MAFKLPEKESFLREAFTLEDLAKIGSGKERPIDFYNIKPQNMNSYGIVGTYYLADKDGDLVLAFATCRNVLISWVFGELFKKDI